MHLGSTELSDFWSKFWKSSQCSSSRVASLFSAAEKGEGASQDLTMSVPCQLLSLLFEPCHTGCHPIILFCLLLPHSPVPLFMGSPERRVDFSSPCLLHTITPICSSRLLVPLFFRVLWIWVQFTLSGMLFWTVLVWERRSGSQASTRCGGNVHLQINQNFLLQKC